jgi:hypothetical protein
MGAMGAMGAVDSTRDPEELAARARHPSAQPWRADVAGMARRLAHHLECEGVERAGVAAHVLAVRGAAGLGRAELAAALAVDDELLARAEAGDIAAVELPAALRRLVQGLV